LTKSSARTVDVAPEVDPVITSPFLNVPEKESCSSTSLLSASKPKASVLSSKTKLLVVPWVSKRILSTSVKEVNVISADSRKRKYEDKNSANLGWSCITNSGNCCFTRFDNFRLFVFLYVVIVIH